MVVFLDLDDESDPPELRDLKAAVAPHWSRPVFDRALLKNPDLEAPVDILVARENPNRNALTEALGCYPIIIQIASSIDLNTLDNLSRTCRQVRENLLQFRRQLIMSTLRCSNEDVVPNHDHTLRYRARAADWYFVEEGGANVVGKVGSCARDMVAECRRCRLVVCRNCTIKPPAPVLLRHRHRRLCPTCTRAPLATLTSPHLNVSDPSIKEVISRSICVCPSEGVWLCQPCGRGIRNDDNTYDSIWRWRTRYSGASWGGLGTGIGEANRSFECGRALDCLAARQVEEEIDCDAEDAREIDANASHNDSGSDRSPGLSTSPTPSNASGSSSQMGPGYARHEIEGIGGVVKKKLVRMVKVGACVTEWPDERAQGKYLVREVEGRTRSWCGWCWRVVPSIRDKESGA